MELRDTIINLIAETLKIPREEIHDTSRLVDIATDSIALFELLIQLESTFNHQVTYEKVVHIETVGDIITYIATLPDNSAEK